MPNCNKSFPKSFLLTTRSQRSSTTRNWRSLDIEIAIKQKLVNNDTGDKDTAALARSVVVVFCNPTDDGGRLTAPINQTGGVEEGGGLQETNILTLYGRDVLCCALLCDRTSQALSLSNVESDSWLVGIVSV